MEKTIDFYGWKVNTSRYYPEGPVVHLENEMVKLTIFGQEQREIKSCEIGNIYDVIFDENGNRRTQNEIMNEVDNVAYYDNDIEVEIEDYIVDEELVCFFDSAEGLTRSEFFEKQEIENTEEALINAPVD